ncbi:MAG TPA: YrdB family protein [Streptosporangiaceae bacterium]
MTAPAGRLLRPALHAVNEAGAFLLELLLLAGLCWWGAAQHDAVAIRVFLAVVAPAAAMIAWGLLAAPRARIRVPLPGVLAVKVVVFGAGVVAVYSIGQHVLAIAFALVAALNTGIAAADRSAGDAAAS